MPEATSEEKYVPYSADNRAASAATSRREESFWRAALRQLFSRRRPRNSSDDDSDDDSATDHHAGSREHRDAEEWVDAYGSPDSLRGRCLRDFRFATEAHPDGVYFCSRCRDVTNAEHRGFRLGDVLHYVKVNGGGDVDELNRDSEPAFGDVVVVGSRCGEVWVAEFDEDEDSDPEEEGSGEGIVVPQPVASPLSVVVPLPLRLMSNVHNSLLGKWAVKKGCARVPLHSSAGAVPVQGKDGEDPRIVRFLRIAPDLAVRRVAPSPTSATDALPQSHEVVFLSPVAMRVGTSWVCGWGGAEVDGTSERTPEGTLMWSASIGLPPV